MNLLERLGTAIKDRVYRTFMIHTGTEDLKELRASGSQVTEIPLAMDGLNRLYILHKNQAIQLSCSVQFEYQSGEEDFIVRAHTPRETKEILRRISSGQKAIKINN